MRPTPTDTAQTLHMQATRFEIDAARARRDGNHNLATVFDRLARDARAEVAGIAAQMRRAA
jgi:hypothetical protein